MKNTFCYFVAAIVDSLLHGQYGAIITYVSAGQTSSTDVITWLSKMVFEYFNDTFGLVHPYFCYIQCVIVCKHIVKTV